MSDLIDNIYKLNKEAKALAQEAWEESEGDMEEAQDYLHQSCDGHEAVIYTYRAWQLCANVDTSEAEQWLDDIGGAWIEGDTVDSFMSRMAFAVLYCAALEELHELEEESE